MASFTLIAGGDTYLQTSGDENPLLMLKPEREPDSLVLLNLETALSVRGNSAVEKAVALHTQPDRATWLAEADVDIVSVANNHVLDLGERGLDDTLDALQAAGVAWTGAGNDRFPERRPHLQCGGLTVAFLAYNATAYKGNGGTPWMNGFDEGAILRDIRDARCTCDTVVLSLHIGVEGAHYPSPERVRTAHAFVDGGATVVLAHHSHVVQGIEPYGCGLIAYSLGNLQFLFGSREERESYLLRITVDESGVTDHRVIPVRIDDRHAPQLAEGEEAKRVIEQVEQRSAVILEDRLTHSLWYADVAQPYVVGNTLAFLKRIRRYGWRHFVSFLRWSVSGFTVRCYLALLRQWVRRRAARFSKRHC